MYLMISDAKKPLNQLEIFLLNERFYQAPMFRFSNFTLMAMKKVISQLLNDLFKKIGRCYFHRSLIKMLI